MSVKLPDDAAEDQSNCPVDYYRRTNGMLHEIPRKHAVADNKIIPNLSDDELRTMAREKLSALVQTLTAIDSPSLLLSVVRETMDRLDGKPTQHIKQEVAHSTKTAASELSTDQIIMALRSAQVAGLLPSNTKLLDDGTVVMEAEFEEIAALPHVVSEE